MQLDACDFNERQVCRFRAMYIFRCIPAGSNKRHEISPIFLGLTEDVILALAGQFKQLSHEPEKFR